MKRQLPFYLLTLLVLFLASCSKKANVPVPADASLVFHFSGSSMQSKLSWDEFKKGTLYTVASENIKDSLGKRILENPETSGIDISGDAFLFLRNRGRGGYACFTCPLKDEKAFTAFIKEASHKDIVQEKGFSVIKDHDNVLTWNSSRFVFIGDLADLGDGMGGGMGSRHFEEDSLLKFASEVYTIKGSDAISSNKKFASMMKEPGDMHCWISPGKLYGNRMGAMIALTKASTLFEGNATAATLNFDNGKITIDSKSYYNKELEALHKKYSTRNLNEDMLKKIPSGNVDAVIAMNYPPEGLKEFMTLLGVDGLVNAFLSDLGFSIDEFIKANKGDLLVSVSDFGINKKQVSYKIGDKDYSYTTDQPDAKILFATSVADKASFQKMVGIVTQKINEQGSAVAEMAGKIPYTLKDDWFVAGNDSSLVYAFGTTSTNQPFISKINGHPMGAYIDIQKFIAGSMPSLSGDSTSLAIATESAKFWQEIVFYGGEMKDGAGIGHVEINLADKNTNSLKQLNNYLGSIAKIIDDREKKRKAMWEAEIMRDSTTATPPMVAPAN